MNINGLFIGNGRNITINSVGEKSTVIVNGKVINDENLNYTSFCKEMTFEPVKALTVESKSTDVLVRKGEKLEVKYYGKFADGEEPKLHYRTLSDTLLISVDEERNTITANCVLEITTPDLEVLNIKTLSGDVSVGISAIVDRICITTTSGDIDFDGKSNNVKVKSTSGDVEVDSDAKDITISTTSGDIDAGIEKNVKCITINSTSGDVNVFSANKKASTKIKTVSGDVRNKLVESNFFIEGTVGIIVNTVSGDISIR